MIRLVYDQVRGVKSEPSWRTLASRTAYSDAWVRVRTDRVLTQAGDVLDPYHVVEYPDWASVVALTEAEHRLILVREYRHGVGAFVTGLPGGLVDPGDGERSISAARVAAGRELLEETGYRARGLRNLLTTWPNPSNQSNTAYVFLADAASRSVPDAALEPGTEVVIEDFVSVLQRLQQGRLTMHAIHVAGLWSAAATVAASADGAHYGTLPSQLRTALGPQAHQYHVARET